MASPSAGQGIRLGSGRLESGEASDATQGGLAFVELSLDPARPFVRQPVTVTVRIGFEREFREQQLIQLFHRKLDLPAQVDAPWLEEVAPGGEGPSLAVGGAVVRAIGAATSADAPPGFDVVELRSTLSFDSPGTHELPPARLHFAYAANFREDLLHGRVPEGRSDAFVTSGPLSVRVRALPERARPPEFSGAVGSFRASASVEPRDLVLGESLRLVVRVAGAGTLGNARAPRFERSSEFEVRGELERSDGAERVFIYDLLPTRAGSREVPALEFPYFDPAGEGAYRSARTEPISIVVRPPAPRNMAVDLTSDADTREGPQLAKGNSPAPREFDWRPVWILAPALALAAWWLRRRSRDPLAARTRSAARRALERLSRSDGDAAETWLTFLAEVLDCPPPAVVGADLSQRLRTKGWDTERAKRATELLDELSAHRYGGPRAQNGEQAARELLNGCLERGPKAGT